MPSIFQIRHDSTSQQSRERVNENRVTEESQARLWAVQHHGDGLSNASHSAEVLARSLFLIVAGFDFRRRTLGLLANSVF